MTDPTPEAPKEPTTEDKKPLSLVYNCHMKGMPPNPHQDWQSYFAHCAATGIISGLRFEAIQPTPSINDTILPETTMTNPTSLSPAAQAVFEAAWAAFWLKNTEHHVDDVSIAELTAAAALRAAALHIDNASDGLECQDILRQIAAELEGGHG